MAKRTDIQSILIIGAGPIIIGQACEFDYSGVQACRVLRENGFIFSSSDVIAVGVSDEPGGLSMLLQLLAKNSIDIQYMYSIFGQSNGMAYMILRVADPAAVSSLLAANGIQLADAATLGIVSAD